MRDEDKPFVMYRRGPWNFNIVPRGVKGWALMGVWLALLAPILIVFERYAEALQGTPMFLVAVGLFVLAVLIWSLAMIAWMKARAEVINVTDMLRQKRENGRKLRR